MIMRACVFKASISFVVRDRSNDLSFCCTELLRDNIWRCLYVTRQSLPKIRQCTHHLSLHQQPSTRIHRCVPIFSKGWNTAAIINDVVQSVARRDRTAVNHCCRHYSAFLIVLRNAVCEWRLLCTWGSSCSDSRWFPALTCFCSYYVYV